MSEKRTVDCSGFSKPRRRTDFSLNRYSFGNRLLAVLTVVLYLVESCMEGVLVYGIIHYFYLQFMIKYLQHTHRHPALYIGKQRPTIIRLHRSKFKSEIYTLFPGYIKHKLPSNTPSILSHSCVSALLLSNNLELHVPLISNRLLLSNHVAPVAASFALARVAVLHCCNL